MTPRLDRYGDPIEDDLAPVVPIRPRSTRKARIAEIRAIIRAAKARREAQP